MASFLTTQKHDSLTAPTSKAGCLPTCVTLGSNCPSINYILSHTKMNPVFAWLALTTTKNTIPSPCSPTAPNSYKAGCFHTCTTLGSNCPSINYISHKKNPVFAWRALTTTTKNHTIPSPCTPTAPTSAH